MSLLEVGARLREERERLGLSQPVLAQAGGVQKNAQIKYEKGERSPDAAYLLGAASLGVDVTYVLSGERLPPRGTYEPPRDPALLAKCVDALNEEMSRRGIVASSDQRGRAYLALYDMASGPGGLTPRLISGVVTLLPAARET